MPNVLFIDCACGHSAILDYDLDSDPQEILPRLRCSSCGIKQIADFRIGWMPDRDFVAAKNTPDSGSY
jgi:hypothetical protein